MKTNACRILEEHSIEYELVKYVGDPTTLVPAALAAAIGQPPERIFKSLVVRGDRSGHTIAVVSIDSTIDLKALARSTKDKRIELAPITKLLALTGYVRGCVTALGTKRPMPVTLDARALAFDRIGVSAGKKGLQLLLAPADYVSVTEATVAPIACAP